MAVSVAQKRWESANSLAEEGQTVLTLLAEGR